MLKVLTATTLAVAFLVTVMPYAVSAETAEQKQELEQKIEVECNTTTSGYGQTTNNCKVLGVNTGKQSQKILLRKGVAPVKKLAATGLDTPVMLAGTLAIGAGAVATYLKSR